MKVKIKNLARPPLKKSDVTRLVRTVERWNNDEKNLQRMYGTKVNAGSERSVKINDAKALLNVLAHLGVTEGVEQ